MINISTKEVGIGMDGKGEMVEWAAATVAPVKCFICFVDNLSSDRSVDTKAKVWIYIYRYSCFCI